VGLGFGKDRGGKGKANERTGIGIYKEVCLVQVLENDAVARVEVLDELLHGDVALREGGREGGRGGRGGGKGDMVSPANRHNKTHTDRTCTA
jgi:hypothetical protein